MSAKTKKFGLILIASITYVVLVIFQLFFVSPHSVVFAQTAGEQQLRILIPRIHVDAIIEIDSNNDNKLIVPPKDPLNTSLFAAGPLPGDAGTSIINGYVNWKYGATAIFADLHFLKPGDSVAVKNSEGVTTFFIVSEIKTYNSYDNLSEIFDSHDNKSHLNLITFDGAWDKTSKSYSKKIVIFTNRESAVRF